MNNKKKSFILEFFFLNKFIKFIDILITRAFKKNRNEK